MYNLFMLQALFILPYLVVLGIDCAIAYFIYKDAKQRYPPGSNEPIIWAIVGFLLSLVGLLIYILIRPKQTYATHSPDSQLAVKPTSHEQIQHLQHSQPTHTQQSQSAFQFQYCPNCGLQTDPTWKVCPKCGSKLK